MAVAKELTTQSWLLETDKGDKLGLISFSSESDKYILIAEDIFLEFGTFDELSSMLGDKVKIEERKEIVVTYNTVEGFPVAHDTAIDVETDDGVTTYRSSERSAVRFYAGYWVIPMPDHASYYSKLSPSDSLIADALNNGCDVKGPFSDKIEATFTAKQMNSAIKQSK